MRVKLDKVCKRIYAGGDVPKGRYSTVKTAEYAIPIYANAEKDNGLYGYTDTARENELSITVAARGTIGFTAIRREPFLPVVRLITVVPDLSTVSERYLYYALRNCKPAFSGTSIPQLTVPDIKKNEIELYSLSVQETIADKLDAVGRIIELRQQQLQKLDDLVKARFVEMFGNPVANEKGWHIELLKDVCNGIGDGLHGTPEYDEVGTYPFINGNNLTNGTIEITPSTKMVNIETYANHYIEISDNAILLSINGTLGKLALYNGEKVMLGKSACYCNLRPEINREFVYGVMRTNAFAEFLESNATASTIKNVGLKAIRNFRLIVPPDDLQTKFVAFSRRIDKSKVAVQKSLNEAQLLFDSLMQQYFG